VTVSYTTKAGSESKALPAVWLEPHEVRLVDFSGVLKEVRGVSVLTAGVDIKASGSPGSLIAALTSVDDARGSAVDVPLVSKSQRSGEGGNHPFRLDEGYRSIAFLTNITDMPTKVVVALFHPGGVYMPELISVEPGATVAVDLLSLRDGQVKDVQGQALPKDISKGQVFWHPHITPFRWGSGRTFVPKVNGFLSTVPARVSAAR
jgi:hypothetical protein